MNMVVEYVFPRTRPRPFYELPDSESPVTTHEVILPQSGLRQVVFTKRNPHETEFHRLVGSMQMGQATIRVPKIQKFN